VAAPVAVAPEDAPERAQVEAMYEQMRVLLRRIGYTDAARETAVMRKYRTLLGRAAPTADEVTLLRGLWYQFAWAVEQVPERLPGPRAGAAPQAAASDEPTV
jgi:tRNA C32,U32 (ribose-2'-O)-methylase TrmJ